MNAKKAHAHGISQAYPAKNAPHTIIHTTGAVAERDKKNNRIFLQDKRVITFYHLKWEHVRGVYFDHICQACASRLLSDSRPAQHGNGFTCATS